MKSCYRLPLAIGLVSLAVIVLGLLFFPDVVYDQFIWKYLWGPIKSDAVGHPVEWHGIWAKEGYTLISEIFYGVLLLLSILGIYKLFKVLKVTIDTAFFYAVLPFIILGPIARVLEDSGLYQPPLVYWFISPLIYVLIALLFFGSFLFGFYLDRSRLPPTMILTLFGGGLVFINLFYVFSYFLWEEACRHFVSPFIIALFSALSFGIVAIALKRKTFSYHVPLFSLGLLYLLPSVYLIARWILGFPWGDAGETYLPVLPIVFGLLAVTLLIVFFLSRKKIIPISLSGINIFLILGQMLDGWTSYVAVKDPFNLGLIYSEKHPLPLFLMDSVHGIAYPLLKLVLILGVIYLIDTPFKEELQKYPNLGNLLKISIVILGFSPGLRDLLRVVMGI